MPSTLKEKGTRLITNFDATIHTRRVRRARLDGEDEQARTRHFLISELFIHRKEKKTLRSDALIDGLIASTAEVQNQT